MTGRVTLCYNINNWGDERKYECLLSWGDGDNRELLTASSRISFEDAKNQALELFRTIPPSEEVNV